MLWRIGEEMRLKIRRASFIVTGMRDRSLPVCGSPFLPLLAG